MRKSRQMLQEIGREPTPEEIAEKLGMPVETVRKVLKIAKEPLSLEIPDRRRGGLAPRRFHRRQERHPADRCGDPIEPARNNHPRARIAHTAGERILRMRFGIGMNADHTLEEVGQQYSADARAHPPNRGQGAKEAEAPGPGKESQELP